MIACDNTDLFGGRITVVAGNEFCCQIETAGPKLISTPATVILELPPQGSASPRMAARLVHDPLWPEDAATKHQSLVEFLDRLARQEQRLLLRAALERACREFSSFGSWEWPEEIAVGNLPQSPAPLDLYEGRVSRQVSAMPRVAAFRNSAAWQGHHDSPLAD